jgi:CBS domain-containing protein
MTSTMPPLLVRHLMHAPVVSLFGDQTMPLAEDIMTFKHVHHLPVIDTDGRVVGVVSDRDLLRAQAICEPGVLITEVMTRDVWTVAPDTLASAAGEVMRDNRFGCLPVVDEAGQLVGILTQHDFLDFAIKAIALHD